MCTNASAHVQAGLNIRLYLPVCLSVCLSVCASYKFLFSITANDCDVIVEAEVEVNNGDHAGRRNQAHHHDHCTRPLTPSWLRLTLPVPMLGTHSQSAQRAIRSVIDLVGIVAYSKLYLCITV